MKILIGAGISFLHPLNEFSKELSKHGVECKVVLDHDYVVEFPSKAIKGLFRTRKKFERLICGSADVVSGRHIVRMTFGQDGLPPLDICQDYACRDKLSPDPRPYIHVFFRIIFLQI